MLAGLSTCVVKVEFLFGIVMKVVGMTNAKVANQVECLHIDMRHLNEIVKCVWFENTFHDKSHVHCKFKHVQHPRDKRMGAELPFHFSSWHYQVSVLLMVIHPVRKTAIELLHDMWKVSVGSAMKVASHFLYGRSLFRINSGFIKRVSFVEEFGQRLIGTRDAVSSTIEQYSTFQDGIISSICCSAGFRSHPSLSEAMRLIRGMTLE
mmetsp:Transcript_14198/g.34480  ORF Transcript_14198/g.34480 Transcript_14198/m.34480 type:complete len:207 (+) Transcript_14198:1841-2461(+)